MWGIRKPMFAKVTLSKNHPRGPPNHTFSVTFVTFQHVSSKKLTMSQGMEIVMPNSL